MPNLIVPKQELQITSWHSPKTQRDVPIITFSAQRDDGVLLQPCQLFGDHKALLEEAMSTGKPLVCDSIKYNDERHRWDIQVPRGSGGEAGYRSKFGGGKAWTPGGYRGQPVPFDKWVSVTTDVLVQMVQAIKTANGTLVGASASDHIADTVLAEARSLVAQYWMAVERNLTFVPGFEPRTDAVAPAPQQAAAGKDVPPPAAAATAADYSRRIKEAMTIKELTVSVLNEILADTTLAPEARQALIDEGLKRRDALLLKGGQA